MLIQFDRYGSTPALVNFEMVLYVTEHYQNHVKFLGRTELHFQGGEVMVVQGNPDEVKARILDAYDHWLDPVERLGLRVPGDHAAPDVVTRYTAEEWREIGDVD